MKLVTLLLIAVPAILSLSSCKKNCTCLCPQQDSVKTLTLQPGPKDGQDCIVASRQGDGGLNAGANHNSNPDIDACQWTYGAEGWGEGTNRVYIKFSDLSTIPKSAIVKSAKLSLYGGTSSVASPQGNSYYPGSPYNSYGDNKCWLKRVVTGNWNESTITWNNKPGVTEIDKVEVPASTSQWSYNVVDLDVTAMVKAMVTENKNYGFLFQLQSEKIYKNLVFLSSSASDASKRPKLIVEYREQ